MVNVSMVDEERPAGVDAAADRLEPSEFGVLYETYRLAVFRYLRARSGSEDEALELAAITFERAYRALGRFRRRDGGVRAWLLRIARNTAIDAHRSRRPTLELAGAEAQLARQAVEANRRGGEREDILDLVARLPAEVGDALMLRYAAGLTAREIGIVIGTREGAVQKRIERGLAALREAYA